MMSAHGQDLQNAIMTLTLHFHLANGKHYHIAASSSYHSSPEDVQVHFEFVGSTIDGIRTIWEQWQKVRCSGIFS